MLWPAGSRERKAVMFESILIPLDGSQSAEAAVTPAEEIAQRFGSQVHLFHAVTPIDEVLEESLPFAAVLSQSDDLRQQFMTRQLEHESAARVYLNSIRERLAMKGIKAQVHLETAPVIDAVLRYVNEAKITAIIMTSHGHGGREFRLYGNIAGELLRRATVPVLLLHPVLNQTP